jgi:hypothetical protein
MRPMPVENVEQALALKCAKQFRAAQLCERA